MTHASNEPNDDIIEPVEPVEVHVKERPPRNAAEFSQAFLEEAQRYREMAEKTLQQPMNTDAVSDLIKKMATPQRHRFVIQRIPKASFDKDDGSIIVIEDPNIIFVTIGHGDATHLYLITTQRVQEPEPTELA